jgi:hypothetical protein
MPVNPLRLDCRGAQFKYRADYRAINPWILLGEYASE